jgi:hypothetical protein
MNDTLVTVIGILPSSVSLPDRQTQVWMPLRINPASPGNRGAHNRQVLARLRTGVTLAAAQDDMRLIATSLAAEHPQNYPEGSGWDISVVPIRDLTVGHLRAPLRLLLVAVLALMTLAAVNVAGLLLAGVTERRGEFATRVALGASATRVVRQTVVEGAIVGGLGTLAALPVAAALLALVETVLPPGVIRPSPVWTDARAITFVAAMTAAAGALAALVAAATARIGHASEAGTGGTPRTGVSCPASWRWSRPGSCSCCSPATSRR